MFFQKKTTKKKVFVGVSGGVDSSVSLALLQEQGYDVYGVFIRTWQPEWMVCTWREERRDAMRVCAYLNVPFLECDLTEVYKVGVADYMIAEYRAGRTPNPDVMCNKVVKFGAFFDWALQHGADAVATGHYAQSSGGKLLRGKDNGKDQSYFLWALACNQLKYILFPVGHLEKKQVRALAKKYHLPTAQKKDSQGICFIGDISMKEFLSHYIEEKWGNVLDETGKVIGYHSGALFFTLGERHGFVITDKGSHDIPSYVVAKDIEQNTITVASLPSAISASHSIKGGDLWFELSLNPDRKRPPLWEGGWRGCFISLHSVNDLANTFSKNPICQCQIRYHGEVKQCKVIDYDQRKQTMKVVLVEPDRTLASGQSVVLYDGDLCLGGGIID